MKNLQVSIGAGPVTDHEDDDWDILYQIEYLIRYRGTATTEGVLDMSLSTDLMSMLKEQQPVIDQDQKEERSRIRWTLRRLFEEGYIAYA